MFPPQIRVKSPVVSALGLGGALLWCALVSPAAQGAPGAVMGARPAAPRAVDFDRDVRPILSENCFACHGPDTATRMAGLRLDTEEGALQRLGTGHAAVVPGKPDASALVKRVAARTMPPASFGKKLTDAQIATLKAWVAQGGKYAQHWAFVPPKRPAVPSVRNRGWVRNPIDAFVLARLEKEGLKPSPQADRVTLIRRVTFDLTGLPPTPEEIDAFLADRSPDAYEKVVDRLLASPHYGERMGLVWLDLARYADTHGYHIDSHRDMWRWRDWVIEAYNRNLPYDRFVTEQLAGDLLPNATLDQKIATGFNRNHPINYEGGAIPEEYHAAYIFDRIDTTATAFMGLTLRCGQCHDHKYDPLTQRDFYRFFAFFNNVPEQGLDGQKGNAVPYIKAPTPEQQTQLAAYDRRIAELEQAEKSRIEATASARAEWEKSQAAAFCQAGGVTQGLVAHYGFDEGSGAELRDLTGAQPAAKVVGSPAWSDGRFARALSFDGTTYADLGPVLNFDRTNAFSYGAWIYPTSGDAGTVISHMDDANGVRGWDLFLAGGMPYVHLIHRWEDDAIRVNAKQPLSLNAWHHLFVSYDGSSKAAGVRLFVDGKPVELAVTHDTLKGTIRVDTPAFIGRRNPSAPFKGKIDEVRVYDRALAKPEVAEIMRTDGVREILGLAPEKRTPAQRDAVARYYLEQNDPEYRKLSSELGEARGQRKALDEAIPTSMVMEEMPKPRETHILTRGEYDKPGEVVSPGIPAVFGQLPKDQTPNRLSLAKWLTSPDHPLTARVAVNRYWQMYFGLGLVRTSENFGTQGEQPSHPELLDWLACRFALGEGETERQRDGAKANGSRPPVSPSLPPSVSPSLQPWDVKALQRLIVTSATYRQSSKIASPSNGSPNPQSVRARINPQSAIRNPQSEDPENRLLSRGPRFRLSAEFVRDQALSASGLLVPKVGGPSVKPYQPAGLWEEIAFGGGFSAQSYVQDHGENLYRRSMYTFWKRTCPPPSLQTLDAPEREFCIVRRSVTNTPLQALVLMNDTTYVEAARKLAERAMRERVSLRDRIVRAFRLCAGRAPRETEIGLLTQVYNTQVTRFRQDPESAKKLLAVGESPWDQSRDPAELAALANLSSVILNLDEAITKN